MSWRPARASKPCCRCAASYPPCRWRRRSRPRISPPSCSLRGCAGSISLATTMRRARARRRVLIDRAQAAGIEAIVLSPTLDDFNEDLRGSASMRYGRRLRLSSPRKTSRAFSNRRREPERGRRNTASAGVSCRVGSRRLSFGSERTAPTAFLEGDRGGKRSGPAMASGRLFSVGGEPPLHREAK